MDGWMDDGWVGRWIDDGRWMDEWMNGWMGGWMMCGWMIYGWMIDR